MTAILFDCETTGTVEPQLIEYASIYLGDCPDYITYGTFTANTERFKPIVPIEYGAMATHHITMDDLEDCRPSSEFYLDFPFDYLIGHNIDFDWQVIGQPEVKRICTLALARKIWPELDCHKQGAILYYLEGYKARDLLKNAHSAKSDVIICGKILKRLILELQPDTWETLWQISEEARIPTVMTFGKHKGTAIKDLPADYISWFLTQADIDPYLKLAFERF